MWASSVCASGIDLEWRVVNPNIRVGDTVSVELYAVSSDGTDQPFLIVDVVFVWDPDVLVLVDQIDNPPWQLTGFPNDDKLNRLNADCGADVFCDPYTFIPFNDGEALFSGAVVFGEEPVATADGLLITTFRFLATAATETGSIQIIERVCRVRECPDCCSESRVVNASGEFLTGQLGSFEIVVAACGSKGDFNNDCLVDSRDFEEFDRCLAGSGEALGLGCEAGDFDGDGDTDLRDAAALQRWATGP